MNSVLTWKHYYTISVGLTWSRIKEPNIIRGGTPYLSHCDATYVAPPAGGNAVDVLSRDHSISYGVVEEQRESLCGHKLYQQ